MSRHLIRWGAAALLVLSFVQPARALPLGGAEDGFALSVGEVWEQLLGSVAETWAETWGEIAGSCPNGICPGDGGDTLNGGGGGGDSAGTCDPNGGKC